MSSCLADSVRTARSAAALRPRKPANRIDADQEFVWVCNIGGRVVGTVGLRHEGHNAARICLFRVDPEWQHTSVPRKLIQCVRAYSRRCGLTRISMEPRVAPRWLLASLRRRGLELVGYTAAWGHPLFEFQVARGA
jgi:N-acetylglutamate synthase-like GNAT family acetyltransferase